MTLKEYRENGGRCYQKLHMGNDLFKFVLRGVDYWGNVSEDFQQETKDIKEGKALVVCPKGVYITQGVDGNPMVGQWGVRVIFPKPAHKEYWENHPSMKGLRELTVEEILEMEKEFNKRYPKNE
jgi:hypothetical protein